MALLSHTEMAKLVGLTSGNLTNMVKRGKAVKNEDGYFDDKQILNKHFIEKRQGRLVDSKQEPETKPQKSSKVVVKDEDTGEDVVIDESTIPSYTQSERLLKYLDTIKREKEIEKLNLEIEKKKGEVIPSELIKPVFLQHNQFVLMEMKNADDEMISVFSHKYDLTAEDTAFIRQEWVKRRNAAISNATTASVKNVGSIVNEFAEKRGKGEKI